MSDDRGYRAPFPVGTVVKLATASALMLVIDFDVRRRETCVAWEMEMDLGSSHECRAGFKSTYEAT